MARPMMQVNHCERGISEASTSMCVPPESIRPMRKWYFTQQEIDNSPSRRDGISIKNESQLRKLYCSFLKEIGVKLKVPQPTISCAMMLCHQFYMRQSHANNGWQAVATASIFLACKIEDTPRYLNDVVFVAYEMIHKRDPSALQRIREKEFLNKQKDFILVTERVLLSTINFDLNIPLPYNILVTALKNLDLLPGLAKAAWNFVNDWLGTSLCLQYKPHYVAAGSIALAAKFQNVKLPKVNGKAWWMEFDVAPKQLEEVFQRMHNLCKPVPPKTGQVVQPEAISKKPTDNSPQSCISSEAIVNQHYKHRGFRVESAVSSSKECIGGEDNTGKDSLPCHSIVVKDSSSVIKPLRSESDDRSSRCKILDVPKRCGEIEMNQIRELKRSRCDKDEDNTRKYAMPCRSSVVKDVSGVIKPMRGESDDRSSRRMIPDVPKRCGEIEKNRIRELKLRSGNEGVNKKTTGSITEELDDATAAKKQRRVYSTSMMLMFRDCRHRHHFSPLCSIQVCCCSFH